MENKVTQNRIVYFDIAKACAILFVIIGHTHTPHGIKYLIYSFHMPFFFLISGYFLRINSNESVWKFICRKAKSYLLPYLITCCSVILFHVFKSAFTDGMVIESALKWGMASLYGLPMDNLPGAPTGIYYIGAIWFLEALFWAEIEVWVLMKIDMSVNLRSLIIVFLNIVAVLSGKFLLLPANINTGLAAGTFVYLAVIIKDNDYYLTYRNKHTLVYCLFLWMICIIGTWVKKQPFYMAYLDYPLFGYEIIGGTAGTFVLLEFSRLISRIKTGHLQFYLNQIGRNTLYIMCVHLFDLDCFGIIINNRWLLLLFRVFFDVVFGVLLGNVVKCTKRAKMRAST